MGIRIHQLPPAIANQIAAGEVIERPASVVKELLENSFDAGATIISIEIVYGGLNQIKISDNGVGIVADDLPLAIAAHATSKIRKLDDLYAIDSMGFRGEALASIASIAKLSLSSKPESQEHAMLLKVAGAEAQITPCARLTGTTIEVNDIFFNAPVRKRFLKSEKLEFQAIETVVKRFALSAAHIALTLKHNGKLVLSLPAAINQQQRLTRMSKIFGSTFSEDAVFLDVERGGMRLWGWVSGFKYQRSQNDRQWVYINQRMVKDKLINHAIKQSYDGILHPGRFPACLLYLTIDNAEVDVNVHPTKHEVRFQQSRLVHDFFTSQITAALATVATDNDTHIASTKNQEVCEPYPSFIETVEKASRGTQLTQVWEPVTEKESSWIVLNHAYTLVCLQQQYYLVDTIKLYQQWLLAQLKKSSFPLAQRPLLVPVSFTLPRDLSINFLTLQTTLAQLAVNVDLSATDTLLVKTVPVLAPYLDIRGFLEAACSLEKPTVDSLLTLFTASQCFDIKLLSTDERLELQQMLLHDKSIAEVFKKLSEEHCRNFLYA